MGAGKTSIGRRLAIYLDIDFIDADEEIIKAAGHSIPDIFNIYGEPKFRELEERVITRILRQERKVLATGGGAYMNPRIRDVIDLKGFCIWLKASHEVLLERTSRQKNRPLLEVGNPKQILHDLIHERYPIYSTADLTIETGKENITETLNKIVDALPSELLPPNRDNPP
tara:strand:+ start:158 stop:667 length:510 start_codon:yes stop_codon:yes gene_type:complete